MQQATLVHLRFREAGPSAPDGAPQVMAWLRVPGLLPPNWNVIVTEAEAHTERITRKGEQSDLDAAVPGLTIAWAAIHAARDGWHARGVDLLPEWFAAWEPGGARARWYALPAEQEAEVRAALTTGATLEAVIETMFPQVRGQSWRVQDGWLLFDAPDQE
jgi:hypothetical protein